MKSLLFLDSYINISDEREEYNKLRKQFQKYAIDSEVKFRNIYKTNYKKLDDVIDKGFGFGIDCLQEPFQAAIDILIKNGVYHIDDEKFYKDYYCNYYVWEDYYDIIEEKYMEIVLKEQELDEYRRERKNNRGRFQGGGFGVEGALKGMMSAGMLNMATGIGHSIFNGLGKIVSTAMAETKKEEIFKNPNTLDILAKGVYETVFNVHYALIEAINDNCDKKILGFVSKENQDKAESILNNLNSRNLDAEIEKSLINEIIALNPYNSDLYEFVINKYKDKMDNIKSVANYFGISIEGSCIELNDDEKAIEEKQKKTGEEICKEKLENEKEQPIQEELIEIEEDAELVKNEETKIMQLFKEADMYDKNNLLELRKNINDNFKTSIKNHYLNIIDNQLLTIKEEQKEEKSLTYKEQDKEEKRVKAITFNDEEEIKKDIEKILAKDNNVLIKEIETAINNLKSGDYSKDLSTKYLKLLEEKLKKRKKEFEDLYKKAKDYEKRKNTGFIIKVSSMIWRFALYIIISILLISFTKWIGLILVCLYTFGHFTLKSEEKKAWIKLTKNGTKNLSSVKDFE